MGKFELSQNPTKSETALCVRLHLMCYHYQQMQAQRDHVEQGSVDNALLTVELVTPAEGSMKKHSFHRICTLPGGQMVIEELFLQNFRFHYSSVESRCFFIQENIFIFKSSLGNLGFFLRKSLCFRYIAIASLT